MELERISHLLESYANVVDPDSGQLSIDLEGQELEACGLPLQSRDSHRPIQSYWTSLQPHHSCNRTWNEWLLPLGRNFGPQLAVDAIVRAGTIQGSRNECIYLTRGPTHKRSRTRYDFFCPMLYLS